MRKFAYLFCFIYVLSLAGCKSASKNVFLVVDFSKQSPITYKLVSERDTLITLGADEKKEKPEKIHEKLELVISYKPVGQTDAYGLTTIEAKCHSAKVTRKTSKKTTGQKDAVESLAGRTFTFKVSPTGKIEDYSNLNELASELGAKTFSKDGQGRIKNPDMIADFVSLQWHLWDSISAAGQTESGLKPGDTWTTPQFIPLSFPVGFTRDTTFTLAEINEDQNEAVITSSFSIGEQGLENWPKIYTGSFDMKGMLGFLSNFRILSIEGSGKQIFDIERGLLENDILQYDAEFSAGLRWPLPGVSPKINVDQKMSVELVEN